MKNILYWKAGGCFGVVVMIKLEPSTGIFSLATERRYSDGIFLGLGIFSKTQTKIKLAQRQVVYQRQSNHTFRSKGFEWFGVTM